MPDVKYKDPKTGELKERKGRQSITPIVTYPEGCSIKNIQGATSGIEGKVRLKYKIIEDKGWSQIDWQAVNHEKNFTYQFEISGLVAGREYELLVEASPIKGNKVSASMQGKFKTAPAVETPSEVNFIVTTGTSYPDVDGTEKSIGRDTILVEHLWEFENIPPSEGVRTDEWKYMRYVNDKSLEELYNLNDDPKEINNLAKNPKYKEVLVELRAKNDELGLRYADPYSGIPSGLTVEYIREPQKTVIVDSKPEFSWLVPTEAVIQKGYQLLVASSKSNIDNNIGDVWDSGNVRSNQSVDVELKGEPLKESTNYFWKVRVFDKDNRLSVYSEPQQFKTGTFEGDITSQNFFQIEKIKPVNSKKTAEGSYFIDFGKHAFGTLELNYKPQKTETLTIRLGEKLLDGKIDQNPGGTIRFQEVKLRIKPEQSTYLLELVPDERNTNELAVLMPDSFPVILPFRYAEIEGAGENFDPNKTIQLAHFNYFDYTSSAFSSSNDILNQVWAMCKYTMKATTFAGYYVDGDRERIPYEADAYLNQLSHYSVDNEYAIARKTIEYFFESKPTWPTEWQLHVAMMMYQDYIYTGNTELLKKYYERLKVKTLMELEVEDGFISSESPNHNAEFLLRLGFPDTTRRLKDIVDWPPKAKSFGGKDPIPGERDGYVFKRINTVELNPPVSGSFYISY